MDNCELDFIGGEVDELRSKLKGQMEELERKKYQLEIMIRHQQVQTAVRESQKEAIKKEIKRLERERKIAELTDQSVSAHAPPPPPPQLVKLSHVASTLAKMCTADSNLLDVVAQSLSDPSGAQRSSNVSDECSQLLSELLESCGHYRSMAAPQHVRSNIELFTNQYKELTFFHTRLEAINRGKAQDMSLGEVVHFATVSKRLIEHQMRLMDQESTAGFDNATIEPISLEKYANPQLLRDTIRGIIMLERTRKEEAQRREQERADSTAIASSSPHSTKWTMSSVWPVFVEQNVLETLTALLEHEKCDVRVAFLLTTAFRTCAAEAKNSQIIANWFRSSECGVRALMTSLCKVIAAISTDIARSELHQRFCTNVLAALQSLTRCGILVPHIQEAIAIGELQEPYRVFPKVLLRAFTSSGSEHIYLCDIRQRCLAILATVCKVPDYVIVLERMLIGKAVLESLCRGQFIRESAACIVSLCQTGSLAVDNLNHMLHLLFAHAIESPNARICHTVASILHDMLASQEALSRPETDRLRMYAKELIQDKNTFYEILSAASPNIVDTYLKLLRTEREKQQSTDAAIGQVIGCVREYIDKNRLPYEACADSDAVHSNKSDTRTHYRSSSVAHMCTPTRSPMLTERRPMRSPASMSLITNPALGEDRYPLDALATPTRLTNARRLNSVSVGFQMFKSKQHLNTRRRIVFDSDVTP